MSIRSGALLLLAAAALAAPVGLFDLRSRTTGVHSTQGAAGSALSAAVLEDQLRFERNEGQFPDGVLFAARGLGRGMLLRASDVVLGGAGEIVTMSWSGGAERPAVEALDPLEVRTHYLRGERSAWRTNVPSYGAVAYRDVYPGVDLVFHGARGGLSYDFRVAPGADPERIELRFDGVDGLRVDEAGRLTSSSGVVLQRAPVAYQPAAGNGEIPVEAAFVVEGDTVRFRIGEYDPSAPLVIDPFIEYATYLGRGDQEVIHDIVAAPDGGLIVAGYTASSDFPVPGGFDRSMDGDEDAFIAKVSPDGSRIEFATFFGGRRNDRANGVALGEDGAIYVVGETRSDDLPTDPNVFQRGFAGGDRDGFAAKLNANGSGLLYATYLGDDDQDWASDIAIDASGTAHIVGGTRSSDFPTTAGAVQQEFGGDPDDAYLIKLDASGRAALYATFLGGRDSDTANAVALDADGSAFVTGTTTSGNFPVSGGAFQTRREGDEDAFIAKVGPLGERLRFSTYFGGDGPDFGNAVAVDSFGDVYLGGFTRSDDLPLDSPSFDPIYNGGGDGFLVKLAGPDGFVLYSTYVGGEDEDAVNALTVDGGDFIVAAGHTKSSDFPVTPDAPQPARADDDGDAFWTRFSEEGGRLLDSTYLGGSRLDEARAVTVGFDGGLFLAGRTTSNDFPVSENPLQSERDSAFDGFVAKVVDNLEIATANAASFIGGSPVAPGSIAAIFGRALADRTVVATEQPLPSELGGVRVSVTDSAGFDRTAALFFVSPAQINIETPPGSRPGLARVTVFRNNRVAAEGVVRIRNAAPGLFAANANGRGVAAGFVVQQHSPSGPTLRIPLFTTPASGRSLPRPITLGGELSTSVLVLFGTGIREANIVTAFIDGEQAQVLFAGAQEEFAGLDQVNVLLERSLAGRGLVEVVVFADGRQSNAVEIFIN